MTAGPFDTEGQVLAAIGYPGRPYPRRAENELALLDACARAGVQLGAYDRRILAWLGGFAPASTCAVIAGIILRAAS